MIENYQIVSDIIAERDRLKELNRELLEALKLCQVRVFMENGSENEAYEKARAVIDKHSKQEKSEPEEMEHIQIEDCNCPNCGEPSAGYRDTSDDIGLVALSCYNCFLKSYIND